MAAVASAIATAIGDMLHGYELRRTTASGQRIARRSPVPHSEEHGPNSGLCMVPVQGFDTETSGPTQYYNRYPEQPNLDVRGGATPHAQARGLAPHGAGAVGVGMVQGYGEMYPSALSANSTQQPAHMPVARTTSTRLQELAKTSKRAPQKTPSETSTPPVRA